jgi:dolichol-phosphate mannosyltransferase
MAETETKVPLTSSPAIPGLACPACRQGLASETDRELRCVGCRRTYPVLDGIPSFAGGGRLLARAPRTCRLSVVIPALDEAESLRRLLPALGDQLKALDIAYEVMVVDGGSRDDTREVAAANGARVETQELPGFGGALRTGFARSGGEYILTLDADGSHDPAFLAHIWQARDKGEVVIGSRYAPGGAADMPLHRTILSRILNLVFRRGLSLGVADLSSGYRLYRHDALDQLQLEASNFDVLEESLVRVLAAGNLVYEVPFRYRARVAGGSHVKFWKFGASYLGTFFKMWRLRNSIASADYDARAYDSIVPLQRYWQRRRHRLITRQAVGFRQVLDVGCGSSRILASNPQWVGLDIQMHKLRYARRFGNPLVQGSIFELPFADASFDCVICSEVIEHVPADERAFDELSRVLTVGGRLILGTPDYDRWSWRALEWLYANVSPGGYADEHITHFARKNLATYLTSRGFLIERTDYVAGSEMVFSLRKQQRAQAALATRPVHEALRSKKGVS